jgi:nanoRNase/pAp phosphatase (c-di-AMP/oligoRNAs hydrolase)
MDKRIINHLDKLLSNTKKLLITTHLSADTDAACSCLLAKYFIEKKYKNIKKLDIKVILPVDNSVFISDEKFDKRYGASSLDEIGIEKYDSVMVVDMGNWANVMPMVDKGSLKGKKVIVIDHHDTRCDIPCDVYINEKRIAAAEQIFVLFKELLGNQFKVNRRIAKYTQEGIIYDSNNFMYEKVSGETFLIMAQLRDIYKVDPVVVLKKMAVITKKSAGIIAQVINNVKFLGDFSYTYIPTNFVESEEYAKDDIKSAWQFYVDHYLRNVEGVNWGCIIRRREKEKGVWAVSLRSINKVRRVDKVGKILGGGGHRNSAGGSIQADSLEEAIKRLLEVIETIKKD